MREVNQSFCQSACTHCGDAVMDDLHTHGEELFCCQGCLNVFLILSENGLGNFYEMSDGVAGVRPSDASEYAYLDSLVEQLALFISDDCVRIRLSIPTIHCISCIHFMQVQQMQREEEIQNQPNQEEE